MSNENYKNRIQEFCQKRKYPLPLYATDQTPNSFDNDFTFNTTLVLIDSDGQRITTDGTGRRKIDAEQNAASQMCTIINQYMKMDQYRVPHNTPEFTSKNSTTRKELYSRGANVAVLIDLENITTGLDDLFNQYTFTPEDKFSFTGFLSVGHHSYQNSKESLTYPNGESSINVWLKSIDSTRRDACDVAMIMHATKMLLYVNGTRVPDVFVIVSGDKFASALTDAINEGVIKPYSRKQVKAIHANSASEIGWRLENLFK
jgi:Double-stranded RNA binding motif